MPTCPSHHEVPYGSRFCGICGTPVPYVGDPAVRREMVWIPESRHVRMRTAEMPRDVWTIIGIGANDPEVPPDIIHGTPQRHQATHEDQGHDWSISADGVFRYSSHSGGDHSVWIMVEYSV